MKRFGLSWQLAPLLLCGWLSTSMLLAAEPMSTPASAEESAAVQRVESVLHSLVLSHLPERYENNKQWGKTIDAVRGLKVERDGFRIETRRRTKPVNHGTWKRYEITLIDPQNTFRLDLIDQKETANGWRVELQCDGRFHLFGRLAQWERGVQLYSFSADADATARLKIICLLKLQLDTNKLPPDVLLRPVVEEAKLELLEYRLQRLSEIHGPLAKHLGESLREVLEDQIAAQNDKLVTKLNSQIEKNKDKLRLSIQDLVKTRWGDLSRWAAGSATDDKSNSSNTNSSAK